MFFYFRVKKYGSTLIEDQKEAFLNKMEKALAEYIREKNSKIYFKKHPQLKLL